MNTKILIAVMFVLSGACDVIQAGGDPDRGRELAVVCADCHGEDGKGDDEIPRLAGLEATYLLEQIQAFASGKRVDELELMAMNVEDLSEQEIADLAAYYASLE